MKVSIITVCKNAQDTVERTIKSVISQDYQDIEYLIIDGNSIDETLNIVNQYRRKIDTIVSEPDKGLYYAMNKGIERSRGDILYFLNAGDMLFKANTISQIVKAFEKTHVDIIYGDIALYNPNQPQKLILRSQKNVSNFFLVHDTIYHQSIFTKKHIFVKYGKFNTQYRLLADYEWILRLFAKHKVSNYYLNQTVAKFLRGGLSFNEIESFKERFKILPLYFNILQVILNGFIFWLIHRVIVKINRELFLKG